MDLDPYGLALRGNLPRRGALEGGRLVLGSGRKIGGLILRAGPDFLCGLFGGRLLASPAGLVGGLEGLGNRLLASSLYLGRLGAGLNLGVPPGRLGAVGLGLSLDLGSLYTRTCGPLLSDLLEDAFNILLGEGLALVSADLGPRVSATLGLSVLNLLGRAGLRGLHFRLGRVLAGEILAAIGRLVDSALALQRLSSLDFGGGH